MQEISIGLMYRHNKTKVDLFSELVSFAATGLEKIFEMLQGKESQIELLYSLQWIY